MNISIYDEKFQAVERTVEAELKELSFGTIRKLMKLVDISNTEDPIAMLRIVSESWGEVIAVLDGVFPDVKEEEWDRVPASHVVRVLIDIAKYSFVEIMQVPDDQKN